MKTVVIKEGFTAYPNGTLREFVAGEEVEVSDVLADDAIEKGLAREKPPTLPKPAKGQKETSK